MIKKLVQHVQVAWSTYRPAIANSIFTEQSMRGLILGLAVFVVTSPFAQAAGDSTVGRTVIMEKCQSCHGKDGLANNYWAPNIAGQKQDYLVRSLNAYKAGERKSPMMSLVVKSLSQEDMDNVAAYYAAIKISVEVPN